MRKITLIYLSLIFLIFQNCGPSPEEIKKIKSQDSLNKADSIKKILEKQKLDSIAAIKEKENKIWEETKSSNSMKSYKNFIDNYPKSQFYNLALDAIDSINYYSIDNWQAYKKFIAGYPKSKYIESIKKKLHKVSFTISQGQKPLSNEEILIFPVIGEKVGQGILGLGKTDENGNVNIEFYNPKNYIKYVLVLHSQNAYLLLYQNNGNALTFDCKDNKLSYDLGKLVFEQYGFTIPGK